MAVRASVGAGEAPHTVQQQRWIKAIRLRVRVAGLGWGPFVVRRSVVVAAREVLVEDL